LDYVWIEVMVLPLELLRPSLRSSFGVSPGEIMPALSETIAALPPLQRRMAEAWLTRFEENWHEQKLRECMAALPAQSSLRRPLLLAMIERDLAHHWEAGRKILVEDYLKDFPELGFANDLPIELIAAEYQIRQQKGGAELSEFAERFPTRIDDLYVQLKPGIFEGSSQAAPKPSGDSLAERRMKLLRAPAAADSSNPIPQRQTALPQSSTPNGPTTPLPASSLKPKSGVQALAPSSIPGVVLSFESTRSPAQKSPIAPAPQVNRPPVESPRPGAWQAVAPAVPPGPVAPAPTPPMVIGRYAIQRRLGSSNQGSNYLAVDTQLDRSVVLKVPRFSGSGIEADRARFFREAKAAAGWHNPMLCPILDVGQADGIDYLASSYIEGECLQDLIRQRPIWPARSAVELVIKLAAALDVAHGMGVVHRDLKPSNIFMMPGEVPVIVGFGQWTRPERAKTPEGALYVAPEQITGPPDAANSRSDIYSLGAILYQLLTGQAPPVVDRSSNPIQYPQDLDPQLRDVCDKAMALYPDERYKSMSEFAKELSGFQQSLGASETSTRIAIAGAAARLPLPPSSQPNMSVGGSSAAYAQMQKLRHLSGSAIPATQPIPVPRSPLQYWKWAIVGAVAVVALIVTLTLLSGGGDHSKNDSNDGANSNAANTPNTSQPPAAESVADLIKDLRSSNSKDREIAVQKLSARNDTETVDALTQVMVTDPWPDDNGPAGEIHDAALRSLIAIDSDKVTAVLRRAAKADEPRTRIWAYGELAKRIDDENRPVLQPNFLAGLRDGSPQVRRAVADQIRKNGLSDPAVIQALVARVSDDVWGEPNNSPPENFIHNPKADGGKDAALDALNKLAPNRVAEALNAAVKSGDLDVRKWAEHQKKNFDFK
jgi:serine/threonine-protein kinase